jgi:hypothetical protein
MLGWNSIQDVNELFHDWESPSHAAKNENMKATQKILQPAAIYNGRPPNLTGPPVFVYHPVFAKFVSQVRMDVDDFEFKEKDIEITQDICELLAQYHDTEPAMQSAIRPLFEWFFGLQNFGPKKIYSGRKWCEPNGQRLVKLPGLYESTAPGFSYVPSKLSELKLGIGSGGCDPIDQGEKDYQLCCMNPNVRPV